MTLSFQKPQRTYATRSREARSFGSEIRARPGDFRARAVGVGHVNQAAEVVARLVGIAARGGSLAGAVEAAQPLRIGDQSGFIGGKRIFGAAAFEQHVAEKLTRRQDAAG